MGKIGKHRKNTHARTKKRISMENTYFVLSERKSLNNSLSILFNISEGHEKLEKITIP